MSAPSHDIDPCIAARASRLLALARRIAAGRYPDDDAVDHAVEALLRDLSVGRVPARRKPAGARPIRRSG